MREARKEEGAPEKGNDSVNLVPLSLDRRYPPQKFRHHSVDDDYYGYGCYGGYYEGYGYDKYVGPHYRSHPGLYQDGKYTHPNARYGQTGPQVSHS